MNITKDRYTHVGLLFTTSAVITYKGLKNSDKSIYILIACIVALVAFLYLYYLTTSASKLHNEIDDIQIKTENGCGFTSEQSKEIDGVKINGIRYKAVNGTDVYIKNNEMLPCGPGSYLMQKLRKGGKEPKEIQNDECWQ